ncbi:hypothetical protein CONLIGDRAFT_324678 [Coniochaeta ligniaria NRRL 30616]|uniref:CENP-V/GFA domain-containing protein n=1 Tax=Coniochaeta ligniaria NRRL 30616 TaxID=1408157 RepID=A0A1J7IQC7_9PEZI|nr:hypothetical protein CONLIGDRAFT_324678 [Coniochaeta ligniaria NRRL 30616]
MQAAQDNNEGQTVTLTSQCLCKAHTFTASVPASSLPIDASCCHCTSCRHSTGAMHSMDIDWPGPTDDIYKSDLRRFDFTSKVKILFCGTCGTPMFFECRYEGPDGPVATGVFSGTLANTAHPNLIHITDHIFVGDTVDGGASMWLRHPNADGTPAKRWTAGKGTSPELPADWSSSAPPSSPPQGPIEVPIWCKCRGVNFVLRPDFSSLPKDAALPFFVDPESKKLLTSFDACDSCRLAFGADIVNWTFALLQHIHFADSPSSDPETKKFPQTAAELKKAVSAAPPGEDRDPRLGTLALYESSPGAQRYFCGRCSASVFYGCDSRQDMVDVAVGVLEGPGGGAARAEEVLAWSYGGKMTWRQDVVGGWREGLVQAVEGEAEEFRVGRGLPVNFRRKIKEANERKG